MAAAERRLDGAIAYRALVRYDAYGELSGHQSTSLALLDAERNGVVLSCIAHRDTARLYCKQVHDGRGEHELSPEEDEAIRLALAGASAAHRDARLMRVGYLGPDGTVSHEALMSAPGADGFELGAAADAARRPCSPCTTATSTARWCRSRTRSRARSTRRSTRSRSRPRTW